MAATGAALLPFVVAPLRAVARGWVPVGDNAIFAIRSRDVFTSHTPSLGMSSSLSASIGEPVNNPGPLHFDLVALPATFLGDAGVAIGVALVNALAVTGVALAARRCGGPRLQLTAVVSVAITCWALGSDLLFDPFPSFSPVLPFVCFGVLAWAVSAGDHWALPWAAGAGSLVLQTHLSYSFLVPALGLWAVVGLALTLRTARRSDPEAWPGVRRHTTRAVVVAGLVFGACWTLPLSEQRWATVTGTSTVCSRGSTTGRRPSAPPRGSS